MFHSLSRWNDFVHHLCGAVNQETRIGGWGRGWVGGGWGVKVWYPCYVWLHASFRAAQNNDWDLSILSRSFLSAFLWELEHVQRGLGPRRPHPPSEVLYQEVHFWTLAGLTGVQVLLHHTRPSQNRALHRTVYWQVWDPAPDDGLLIYWSSASITRR